MCLLHFLLLLSAVTGSDVFCDGELYGKPLIADCHKALSRFPEDRTIRFFVDQESRSSAEQLNWRQPPDGGATPVQIPQRVSDGEPSHVRLRSNTLMVMFMHPGKCNVALFSYHHKSITNPAARMSWAAIFEAGMVLNTACLFVNMGGAAVVNGMWCLEWTQIMAPQLTH